MGLETATYVDGLNSSNPAATDGLAQADDHIRLIKSTIKNTFPNLDAAMTASEDDLNLMTGISGTTPTTGQIVQVNAGGTLELADQADSFPTGGIIMWSGTIATIPTGWALCDGNNGTPNLTGRFVVHADADSGGTYAPNATGGSDSVALTEANMPSHSHTFSGTTNTTGAHTHDVAWSAAEGGSGSGSRVENYPSTYARSTSSAGDHSHTFSGTTSSTGSGTAHENRPPYYALAYIMKT